MKHVVSQYSKLRNVGHVKRLFPLGRGDSGGEGSRFIGLTTQRGMRG